MSLLRQQKLITGYHHRQIIPGTDWSQAINAQIGVASVILLLISSDFLASDYCYGVEMQKALERHNAGTAHVIPVLLRPVDWHDAPFAHLHCLPNNKNPITSWTNRDEAFRDVATGIRKLLENVYGIPSRQANHRTSSVSREHRIRMLKQVRAFWIDGVLERSLHHMALITLRLHEQPNVVANPWRLVMQEAERPTYPLPVGTRIIDVYNNSDGKLLILGKPGAGKTTLLLELARDLLVYAEQDRAYPVPVVFHLSSWTDKTSSLTHWLVNELQNKYQLSRKVGQDWINTDKVLLLLDGFDEVPQEARSSCIRAINIYHQEHNLVSIVLCSRSIEYSAQITQIALQTAVEIQPLTKQQINEYLLMAGEQLEALRVILHGDVILSELSTTPLMLNVMILAYQGKDVKDVVFEKSKKELFGELAEFSASLLTTQRQEVFKTYIQRMLHRRGSSNHFSSQDVVRWLTWVAQNSHGDISTTLFRRPQDPDFLALGWPQRIRMGVMVISALVLSALPVYFGIVTLGLLVSSLIALCLETALSGLLLAITLRYIRSGGDTSEVGSAKTSMIYSIPLIIIFAISMIIVSQKWLVMLLSIPSLILFGILLQFLIALWHLINRIMLCLNKKIPWDHKIFLDYAVEHALLYKVGDKYIFIHYLMGEYFRSLYVPPTKRKHHNRTSE